MRFPSCAALSCLSLFSVCLAAQNPAVLLPDGATIHLPTGPKTRDWRVSIVDARPESAALVFEFEYVDLGKRATVGYVYRRAAEARAPHDELAHLIGLSRLAAEQVGDAPTNSGGRAPVRILNEGAHKGMLATHRVLPHPNGSIFFFLFGPEEVFYRSSANVFRPIIETYEIGPLWLAEQNRPPTWMAYAAGLLLALNVGLIAYGFRAIVRRGGGEEF